MKKMVTERCQAPCRRTDLAGTVHPPGY